MGFFSSLKKAFKSVAKVALVVVAIVQPELIPAIGSALGAPAAYATAAGAAAINTASALASGATPEQALKAGAAAGVAAGVAQGVGAEYGKAAGSAAGGAAGTVVAGGGAQDILRNAIAGATASTVDNYAGSTAGAATGAAIASKGDLLSTASAAAAGAFSDYKSQKGAFSPTEVSGAPTTEPPRFLASADTGTVSDMPTLSQTAMSEALGAQREPTTDLGELTITATRYPYSQFTSVPKMTITGQRPTPTPKGTEPAVEPTDATEREGTLAKETPGTDTGRYYTYRGTTAKGGAPTGGSLARVLRTEMAAPVSTTGLTGYRPAGEIESEESGKGRQDVWNEASLRLKDALGL